MTWKVVTICGLKSKPELNGEKGVVLEELSNGRLKVIVCASNVLLSVSPESVIYDVDRAEESVNSPEGKPRLLTKAIFLGLFEIVVEKFNKDETYLGTARPKCYNGLKQCLAKLESNEELQIFLFRLALALQKLFDSYVTNAPGPPEQRRSLAFIMSNKYSLSRIEMTNIYVDEFSLLKCIKETRDIGNRGRQAPEEARLVFHNLEESLYYAFIAWLNKEYGCDVIDYVMERPNDSSYEFSLPLQRKIYDITGYVCGHRILNLLAKRKLRVGVKEVFKSYANFAQTSLTNSSSQKLPCELLLFREYSRGLFYSKEANFRFISILQAIWMQSIRTETYILFKAGAWNAPQPIPLVTDIMMNSKVIQKAFLDSCDPEMLKQYYKPDYNIATMSMPIAALYQFLIQGFMKVYSKDIYTTRVAACLFRKGGVNEIRPTLFNSHPNLFCGSEFTCYCGNKFYIESKGWIERHMLACSIFKHRAGKKTGEIPDVDPETAYLDKLVKLEFAEDEDDFTLDLPECELREKESKEIINYETDHLCKN